MGDAAYLLKRRFSMVPGGMRGEPAPASSWRIRCGEGDALVASSLGAFLVEKTVCGLLMLEEVEETEVSADEEKRTFDGFLFGPRSASTVGAK